MKEVKQSWSTHRLQKTGLNSVGRKKKRARVEDEEIEESEDELAR